VGVPGKSPLSGTHFSHDACKAECESEPKCEGIVVVRDVETSQCWLVQDLNPRTCVKNTDYDLWQLVPATAGEEGTDTEAPPSSSPPGTTLSPQLPAPSSSGQSPTSAPTPAATPSSTAWVHHKDYNCFGGQGAVGVPGKSPLSGTHFSHDACKAECESEPKCEGIVVVRDVETSQCWLVQDLNPRTCVKNTDYDLWQLVPATAGEEGTDTETPPSSSPLGTTLSPQLPVSSDPILICALGESVKCPHSNARCSGNQCCPGPNGGPDSPCPSADPDFRGCESPQKDPRYDCVLAQKAATSPEPNHAALGNVYEKASRVGAWGGTCTCPDGQSYNVGDKFDGCANGPSSLACYGGTPGDCNKVVDQRRDGMRVTCASSSPAAPLLDSSSASGPPQTHPPKRHPPKRHP